MKNDEWKMPFDFAQDDTKKWRMKSALRLRSGWHWKVKNEKANMGQIAQIWTMRKNKLRRKLVEFSASCIKGVESDLNLRRSVTPHLFQERRRGWGLEKKVD
jgi:hypothetical protein